MWFQIKAYFKFLWKSTNQHGVHSPFVFDLVTKCFYDQTQYSAYSLLKNYRQSLLRNHNMINVTDFGAGSKVFKSDQRQISKIAATAGIKQKNSELLFRMARYFKSDNILEIGTSLGLATAALALGSRDEENLRSANNPTKVTTLEGCPETANVASRQFEHFDFKNIHLITGEFENSITKYQLSNTNYQLVYFDGNHEKDATLHYFNLLLPTATNDSVWIFDDIHWSAEMGAAWEIIKENPRVTVTVDTFQWGIICFRKEQEKEHFIIRC